MHKSQYRNARIMKKQGNLNPLEAYKSSISEFQNTAMVKMLDKEFKSLVSMTSNKQMKEVRKPIQDLDENVSKMDEKFSKVIKILKRKNGNVGNEKLNESNF
jgi:hypothetical protein